MAMTGLTGPLIKIPLQFFMTKMRPLVDYLHNPSIQLIEKSDDGLLSLFLMMVNYIVRLRMISLKVFGS
jgi:hypothetical protein